MYECNDCGRSFDELISIKTSYENYYGVGSLFSNHHSLTIDVCPYCKSEDWEEVDDDDEDEEEECSEE